MDSRRPACPGERHRSVVASPPGLNLGSVHGVVGDRDRAFAELERAFRERDLWIVFLAWLPKPDWLRTDPRYLDLTTRINLPG